MTEDDLLAIWTDTPPNTFSPYWVFGNPPMWRIADYEDDSTLFARPGKITLRPTPDAPHEDVDGVHYQWRRDGVWIGIGHQAKIGPFLRELNASHPEKIVKAPVTKSLIAMPTAGTLIHSDDLYDVIDHGEIGVVVRPKATEDSEWFLDDDADRIKALVSGDSPPESLRKRMETGDFEETTPPAP